MPAPEMLHVSVMVTKLTLKGVCDCNSHCFPVENTATWLKLTDYYCGIKSDLTSFIDVSWVPVGGVVIMGSLKHYDSLSIKCM